MRLESVTLFLLVAAVDHPWQGAAAAVGAPRGRKAAVEGGLKPLSAGSALPGAQPQSDGRGAIPACGLLPPLLRHGRVASPAGPGMPSVEMSCDPAGAWAALPGLAVPPLPV